MTSTRYAADITVDIYDLDTEAEAEEIRDLIEAAIAAWDPTITVTTRQYPTA